MANCMYCGSALRDGAKFCLSCGKPQMTGMAAAAPGEVTMGEFGGVMGMVNQGVNMVRGVSGKLAGLKDKKKNLVGPIITAVVFAILWIVQYILGQKGIDNPFTKVLGWLTYSSGGTSNKFLPMIGGFFGKGMVVMAFCSLFNGGAKSMVGGIKKAFSGEVFKGINVGPILLGFGVAMVCYQFFTGYGTLTGGMTAVGGLAVALRSLGGGGGLIRFMVGLVTTKNKMVENKTGSTMWGGFSMGMSFGFTAAIPLAAIKYSWTHIFVGAGCVIVGLIIVMATKDMESKKMQGPQYPGGMMN